MSFELFMQCFEYGHSGGVPERVLREAFSNFDEDCEPDYWRLRYDERNSCDIAITRIDGQAELVSDLTVHRPCEDQRLWDSIYRVLESGPWVLYFPSENPTLIVANREHSDHLPAEMVASFDGVQVVGSGVEILKLVCAGDGSVVAEGH